MHRYDPPSRDVTLIGGTPLSTGSEKSRNLLSQRDLPRAIPFHRSHFPSYTIFSLRRTFLQVSGFKPHKSSTKPIYPDASVIRKFANSLRIPGFCLTSQAALDCWTSVSTARTTTKTTDFVIWKEKKSLDDA